MDTTGMNSKKIALLIAVLAAIGLITGFAIWYVTSKAEESTTGSSLNKENDSSPNTAQNQEESAEREENNVDLNEELSNDSNEQKTWFTSKDGNNHFKLFSKLFNKVLKNSPKSIFNENNESISKEDKETYSEIKDELLPLLHAINYNLLVVSTELPLNTATGQALFMTALTSSKKELLSHKINELTEDEAKKTLVKLLNNSKVIKELVISHEDIRKLEHMRLTGLRFETLPNVFKVFKSLETIYLKETGLKSLDPLNEATSLINIDVEGNIIEEIPELDKLTSLEYLNLFGNPIKEIASNFLEKHQNFRNGSVILGSANKNAELSETSRNLATNSNGKIVGV